MCERALARFSQTHFRIRRWICVKQQYAQARTNGYAGYAKLQISHICVNVNVLHAIHMRLMEKASVKEGNQNNNKDDDDDDGGGGNSQPPSSLAYICILRVYASTVVGHEKWAERQTHVVSSPQKKKQKNMWGISFSIWRSLRSASSR